MGVWTPDLYDIVSEFPPKLKQAMYVAANNGTIRRGTWNNCALNAASKIQEAAFSNVVSSFGTAARAFEITPALAKMFVYCWDKRTREFITDSDATEFLKETILKVGLFEPAKVNLPGIIRFKIYSEIEEDKKKFEALLKANGIADLEEDINLAQFFFVNPEEIESINV